MGIVLVKTSELLEVVLSQDNHVHPKDCDPIVVHDGVDHYIMRAIPVSGANLVEDGAVRFWARPLSVTDAARLSPGRDISATDPEGLLEHELGWCRGGVVRMRASDGEVIDGGDAVAECLARNGDDGIRAIGALYALLVRLTHRPAEFFRPGLTG